MSHLSWLSLSAVVALNLASPQAHAATLTSNCDGAVTTADRQAIDDAATWLSEYAQRVTELHSHDLHGDDVFGFFDTDPAILDHWVERIGMLNRGEIRIECYYEDDVSFLNKCDSLIGRDWTMGFASDNDDTQDVVNLCPDNIAAWIADNYGNTTTSMMVHTLAHEVMHGADGNSSHGIDQTDIWEVQTEAESIGLTAEVLYLTADYQLEMLSQQVSQSSASHTFDVEFQVSNQSSESRYNHWFFREWWLNEYGTIGCLQLDGQVVGPDPDYLGWIIPTTLSDVVSMGVSIPPYEPGVPVRAFVVDGECYDNFFEADDDNDRTTILHSTEVDLALSLDLAATPTHHSGYRYDLDIGGYYHWFEVRWAATITNLDGDTRSPAVDLAVLFDEMGSTSAAYGRKNVALPSMGPGETVTAWVTLEIPANAAGTLPDGATRTHWRVDYDAQDMHDRDWSNNYVGLTVDAAWWRPDYRVELRDLHTTGTVGRQYDATVRNMGPVAATASSWLDVSGQGLTSPGLASLSPLAPGQGHTVGIELELPGPCAELDYAITADFGDAIRENDEDNNVAAVTQGDLCMPFAWQSALDEGIALNLAEELLYGRVNQPNLDQLLAEFAQMRAWFTEILENQSHGPFLPPVWMQDYAHAFDLTPEVYILFSTPTVTTGWTAEAAEPAIPSTVLNGRLLFGTAQSAFPEPIFYDAGDIGR